MKHEYRTMKRGELYEIEEKIGDGQWAEVCQCSTTNEAKEVLKNLKTLDGEKNDG